MISVCIATYNGEKYIREQLDSILCQLSDIDEIIISDDGSTDSTLSIIRQYNDNRIKVFNNNMTHGVVSNFENALKHASGEYIFLSDQDDIWLMDKTEKCVNLLQIYDLVVHNATMADANGRTIGQDFFTIRKSRGGFWYNLYKNRFVGCCICFRRSLLAYVLPFPKQILWHDMWIGLIAEKHGQVYFDSTPLIFFRRHGDNTSQTGEKSSFHFSQQLSYRFWMLLYSIGR